LEAKQPKPVVRLLRARPGDFSTVENTWPAAGGHPCPAMRGACLPESPARAPMPEAIPDVHESTWGLVNGLAELVHAPAAGQLVQRTSSSLPGRNYWRNLFRSRHCRFGPLCVGLLDGLRRHLGWRLRRLHHRLLRRHLLTSGLPCDGRLRTLFPEFRPTLLGGLDNGFASSRAHSTLPFRCFGRCGALRFGRGVPRFFQCRPATTLSFRHLSAHGCAALAPGPGSFRRCRCRRSRATTEHLPDIGNLGIYALALCFEAVERHLKYLGAEFAGYGHTRAL
jgi:hypothetical protein